MIRPEEIKNSKVILTVLDWGFGHTTRCISIIKKLLKNNNTLHIAGNESQLAFYQKDFPDQIVFHKLEGYNIKLNPNKSTYRQLAMQSLALNKRINQEKEWLTNLDKKENFDFVISDNRYGFLLEDKTSIIICHQVNLQVPFGQKSANMLHAKCLNKFNTCWIPDNANHEFSGNLSEGELAIPTLFIGPLCRFEPLNDIEKKYDYLILISGPEPAKTQFLTQIIEKYHPNPEIKLAIVNTNPSIPNSNADYYENPSTQELNKLIHSSNEVISRAGYTTIMELSSLNKECILIPTPGQYEQLYLSTHIKRPSIIFLSEKDFLN